MLESLREQSFYSMKFRKILKTGKYSSIEIENNASENKVGLKISSSAICFTRAVNSAAVKAPMVPGWLR